MVECSRCCCRCGGAKMVLRELEMCIRDRWCAKDGGVFALLLQMRRREDGAAGTRGSRKWSRYNGAKRERRRHGAVAVVLSLLVRRRQWCDGDAVVAGEVRRCGGGCHGGGRREEN
ncbi:hypothetical protein DEO72_LG6g1137 [Vigna unguiculata]|uniref:Uncharacterized protein n=1 Tax=Vigna unguiculata TaxID=3917 RepID=A0A4D6M9D4_VIGUN|nr:hypothetical protein DEO72_LG6g1137 [Vigna unguiculata]